MRIWLVSVILILSAGAYWQFFSRSGFHRACDALDTLLVDPNFKSKDIAIRATIAAMANLAPPDKLKFIRNAMKEIAGPDFKCESMNSIWSFTD